MLRTAEASARLEGSRDELFAIVADSARYESWVPGIEHSWLLAREGDVSVTEVRAPRWSDRSFALELVHSLPGTVVFRQIDGGERPRIKGRWELGETEPGVGASTVPVSVHLTLDTPLLALGSRRRLKAALRAGLDALASRRRQLASALPVDMKQKVLELVREAGGLKVWYMGESFFLPRVEEPAER